MYLYRPDLRATISLPASSSAKCALAVLRDDPSLMRKLGSGQRLATIHEHAKDVGTRRTSAQRSNTRNFSALFQNVAFVL